VPHALPAAAPTLARALARGLASAALVIAVAAVVPRALCGRAAGPLFDGDAAAQDALARGVAAYVEAGVGPASFHTGSARFDGEWSLVTEEMAALGLGQVILAHPELGARYRPALDACAARLLDPATLAFGAAAWGASGLDDPDRAHGHAYLGYVALGLGMIRLVSPAAPAAVARAHDRLVAALALRLETAPHALVETYPGEAYPADVASIAGAIGLHDRVTASDHGALLRRFSATFRERWIDQASGLLYQAGDAARGVPSGPPRASGTALAAYFLSFADPALARDLFAAVARSQRESFLGFGGVREHAPGHAGGADVDSGPVLLGVSVSATGFALAGARATGDRPLFTELYRTADLFGVPLGGASGRRFVTGGPLGNALLLAMLTAPPWP
jgi:hypothetical protein